MTKTNALFTLAFTLTAACAAERDDKETTVPRSGYTEINGVRYYHEIHGEGPPVLLLHGGLMSSGSFAAVLPAFTARHQVIAVDLQGHGRTNLGDRPIRLADLGDDMAALIDELGYEQVDVVGYSFGGGTALRLAIQHPDKVRRLVVVSAPIARDGWFAEMLPQQAAVGAAMFEAMKESPLYTAYAAVAPDPGEFPRLLDAMGELMRTPYDWRAEIPKITAKTLLVYGDADMVHPAHAVETYQLLGGGLRDAGWQREHMSTNRLAIVPDLTHYEMFDTDRIATTILPFLD